MKLRMKTPLTVYSGSGFDQVLWDDVVQLLILPYVRLRTAAEPVANAPVIACRGSAQTGGALAPTTEHAAPADAFSAYLHGRPVAHSPLETVLLWADALQAAAAQDDLPRLSDFASKLRQCAEEISEDDTLRPDARAAVRSMAERLELLTEEPEPTLSLTDPNGSEVLFTPVESILIGDRCYRLLEQQDGDDLVFVEEIEPDDADEPEYRTIEDEDVMRLLEEMAEEIFL